ncbi:hypothetical protein CC78DRAFT_622224, partial [Lojkania enalia]
MVKATEFTISIGSAVRLRWRESEDGSIIISASRTADTPGGIEKLTLCDKSTWSYAERCGYGSKTITFNALNNPNVVGASDASTTERAGRLRKKIEDCWENVEQTLTANMMSWREPVNFFGTSKFNSTEDLSYQALENLRNNLHQYQTPFHKLNLASFDKIRTRSAKLSNPEFSIPNCRRSLLNTLHPGYGALDKQKRKNICKRYTTIIAQGAALLLLSQNNAGLLLTVGPVLSGTDLDFVSEQLSQGASILELLGEKTIKNSRRYKELVLGLCGYLEGTRDLLREGKIVPKKRRVPHDEPDGPPQRSYSHVSPAIQTTISSEMDMNMLRQLRESGDAREQQSGSLRSVEARGTQDSLSGPESDQLDECRFITAVDTPRAGDLGGTEEGLSSRFPGFASIGKQHEGIVGVSITGEKVVVEESDLPSVCVTDMLMEDRELQEYVDLYRPDEP